MMLARFCATGNVAHTKQKKKMTVATNEENEFLVLESIVESPNKSARNFAIPTSISQSSIEIENFQIDG